MTMDNESPESRRERSIEMRDQDVSSIRERWAGEYDDMEEDGVEKPRESSKHRVKEKSKSSRREDKDHRSKDREQQKTGHGSKDREKEFKDSEKDSLSGRDRRNENGNNTEKEKSHDKARDRGVDREKYKDRERDKDRGKEKERERERELDRDAERGRDKERGKDKSRDKDKDKDKEKEREKHKDQGKGRENDRDRTRNVDKEKGKERTRDKEREADQDRERQREKDRGSHKHRDEGHDRSKDLRKDDKSSFGTIDDQDASRLDAGLHDSEDGAMTLKHQQIADGGGAGSHSSASELEERIRKMREERLKKDVSETLSWVSKSRKLEEKRNVEREKALQRSKIFEEQDKMNEGGSDDDDTMQNASHDLGGVKVLHGLDKVLEGGTVVLTLKDQSILSGAGVNEEVDVLENVEIGEQKRRDDAYKAAKKRTGIYDDKFNDNDETGSERKILPKYDDPVVDEGVTLDARGRFTGEAEKKLEELRRRIQGSSKRNYAEDLSASGKVLSDFYTQDEMLQFKKPKKKKSLRKKQKLDIDALEAEAKSAGLGVGDLGSRNDGKGQFLREEQERNDAEMRSNAYQSAFAKADEKSKALRLDQNRITEKEEDDNPVIGDDDDDLRKSLDRARKLALKKQDDALTSNPLAIALLLSSGAGDLAVENQNSASTETEEKKVVFTELELWSHQLDEEPRKPDAEDVFMEEDVVPNAPELEAKDDDGGWSEVKESLGQETPESKEEEMVPEDTIHEVPVGKGLSGALKLLKDRGSLKETVEWGGRNMDKKKSKLVGIHDDEGPKEIHLERTDEYGRILTPKEAFRLISHKFHGKGPGKMKQEKRMRQYQEELKVKQMKNADTPSLSVERMKEAQANLKTPYLVLSGHVKPGQTSDPRSSFAAVEKGLPGGLTPMLGDKKVEYFLGKRKPEPGT